ncbi:MAG: energy-coupling factor transporter transmembrane component T [Actinomycetota bacterium]|nr:energy-coupling factor transporter transmembrane component T [Actinomycetota bacterium]
MDISFIDNLAYNTDSIMHRASALSKVVMVAFVIAAVVISLDPTVLTIALITLLIMIPLSNLPVHKILIFGGYALFFGLIFALSQTGGGIVASAIIVLKAETAAISLILLITTTPYPQIFAILQKVLPSILVDAMLITYRTFFILIKQVNNRLTAIRVRGGYSALGIRKNLGSIGRIIGHGLIHAWELSESMQNVMFVRGYKGKLPVSFSWRSVGIYDILPLTIGVAIFALAVVR